MPLLPLRVSLTRTVTLFAIGIFLASPSFGQGGHPNDYIRSTRPLKSGGSITSISSQGQKRSWVNQPTESPQARTASLDTGSNQGLSPASTSFYRQAQTGNTGAGIYPYPESASSSTVANTPSRFASDQPAQLRFERAAVGDRNTGDLGNTAPATALPASFGQRFTVPNPTVPTPAARVAQAPAGSQSRSTNSVVNPNATAAAFNSGPNYVNPNLNFAGYQGYQPGAVAANSVPALNTNVARVAQNCCAPTTNCCCSCQPQAQAQTQPFQPFPVSAQANTRFQSPQSPQAQGFQFQQPNIGVPQLSGNTGGGIGSGFCNWLKGSGSASGLSANSLASVLPFRNLPPSTYLGQGLIGQPTAYVDGQPFRNLFRYISP